MRYISHPPTHLCDNSTVKPFCRVNSEASTHRKPTQAVLNGLDNNFPTFVFVNRGM